MINVLLLGAVCARCNWIAPSIHSQNNIRSVIASLKYSILCHRIRRRVATEAMDMLLVMRLWRFIDLFRMYIYSIL